jgi:hypothetical protein
MRRFIVSVSHRVLVLGLFGLVCMAIGAGAAQGAPLLQDLMQDGNIIFSGPGVDGARDIRTSDNDGGLRFYNGTSLDLIPQGAAIQFFGNDRAFFNGQAFIDSGAHNNAAVILRTAQAGGAITDRLRVEADGRVRIGDVESGFCLNAGDLCVGDDLAVDDDGVIGGELQVSDILRVGGVSSGFCLNAGDVCAGDDLAVDDDGVIGGLLQVSELVQVGSVNSTQCLDPGDVCAGDDLVADNDVFVGNACVKDGTGAIIAGVCVSDLRLKDNIAPLNPVLAGLIALEPVTFDWRRDEYPDLRLGSEREYGLIAQQVEQFLPELVAEKENGFKAVHYERLPLLLLQGMREMQTENDALREQVVTQQADLDDVRSRLAALERALVGSRQQ